jgi:hypothetical protein
MIDFNQFYRVRGIVVSGPAYKITIRTFAPYYLFGCKENKVIRILCYNNDNNNLLPPKISHLKYCNKHSVMQISVQRYNIQWVRSGFSVSLVLH